VEGRRLETRFGSAFLCETLVAADQTHGRLPVEALAALPGAAAVLTPKAIE
jgi:hypothetical protein